MADKFRYRYGDTNPVDIAWDSGTAVEIGDLVFVDTADGYAAKPASSVTWDTDLATTQEAFHPLFLGVAMQRYDGSNANAYGVKDGKLRVATSGVFEFDSASASYNVGDLVGPAKQSGNLLEKQKVAAVASAARAVGNVVRATSSETTVLVKITSIKANLLA